MDMGSWRVVLFVLSIIVLGLSEASWARKIHRRSTKQKRSSIIHDTKKRLDVLEAVNNVTAVERLADLEKSLLNAIKVGLENLEMKIRNDTEARFATLETRSEDLRAIVSEMDGTNRTARARTVEDSERPEKKPVCKMEELNQCPGTESPLHDPDRLAKVEQGLSCMQQVLAGHGRSSPDKQKVAGAAADTTPGDRAASEEAMKEMMKQLLNATERKLMSALQDRLTTPAPPVPSVQPTMKQESCEKYLTSGHYTSGIYTLYLRDNRQPIEVFCDMDTVGGGWAVIQRRLDGSENFYRNWTEYERGFGNLSSEFWLGNDKIHRLTSNSRLLILMEDWKGNTAQAWRLLEVQRWSEIHHARPRQRPSRHPSLFPNAQEFLVAQPVYPEQPERSLRLQGQQQQPLRLLVPVAGNASPQARRNANQGKLKQISLWLRRPPRGRQVCSSILGWVTSKTLKRAIYSFPAKTSGITGTVPG